MIDVRCISKSYGPTMANNCLTLSILPGEILGVLGENGAGKSTLLSILAGMVQPDSGQLLINGTPTTFGSPRDALKAGVSVVYQHFSLIPTFTVREQMRLAGWTSKHLPDLLGSRFDGREEISQISLGERQMVEIAKALVSQPRVLLLDEPTSILTSAETGHLFDMMRGRRSEGASVVFVTHKLHEAMELCDRIVVLRQGEAVGSIDRPHAHWPADAESRLLGYMFGRGDDVSDADSIQSHAPAPANNQHVEHAEPGQRTFYQLKDVSTVASPGRRALHHVSLKLSAGEIYAIVGVDGQGQRELAEICAGYANATGTISLREKTLPIGSPQTFRQRGIAYITDDRVGEGTVPAFSIEDNLVMKRQRTWPFSRFGLLRRSSIRKHAEALIARWNIEPPYADMPIGQLSGGNMQKALLARELDMASSLVVANKPSQGLDVRTQRHVWSELRTFVFSQGAVLLITTDVDEALMHADRVAVMYNGRVSDVMPATAGIRPGLERMMVAGWG